MMGFQGTPARLFYDFCLDDHVPSDHLLRGIDGHVDFEGLRPETLRPFYMFDPGHGGHSHQGVLAWT